MFILDSLMIAGIRWALETTITAAEAEMNDDTALREQLLEMEMRREMGEISDEEFAEAEADLLARIREIKARREGGTGAFAFAAGEAMETSADSRFQVEASVSGDFYDPAEAPHTTIVEREPRHEEEIRVLDVVPGDAQPDQQRGLPLSREPKRSKRGSTGSRGSKGSKGSKGSARTTRTSRTTRTKRR
jgi:hypothetical protein